MQRCHKHIHTYGRTARNAFPSSMFFSWERRRRALVSQLLALLTGPQGAIKDLGQPWAAPQIQEESVATEMKTLQGQPLADQQDDSLGPENKSETSPEFPRGSGIPDCNSKLSLLIYSWVV